MKEVKEQFQEQIIFEEKTEKQLPDLVEQIEQHVEIDNSKWQEAEQELLSNINEPPVTKKNNRYLLKALLAVFTVLVGVELVDFFILGFEQNPIISSLYALLLLLLGIITGKAVFGEIRGLMQLKKREEFQQSYSDALLGDDKRSADNICSDIENLLAVDTQGIEWQQKTKALNANETFQYFSEQVLAQADKKAVERVAKHASESAVLIAVCPLAIADMLLILWRNLRLVNDVSQIYGVRLSYFARIKLVKQVFRNMVYAGASELAVDFGADLLGIEFMGKLSGRLGQGLGAGMLTARLGLNTIKMCRPLPVSNEKLGANDVRKAIAGEIKKLIKK